MPIQHFNFTLECALTNQKSLKTILQAEIQTPKLILAKIPDVTFIKRASDVSSAMKGTKSLRILSDSTTVKKYDSFYIYF